MMREFTARPRLATVRYDQPPSSPLLRLTVAWSEHEEAWQEYARRGGSKGCEAVATGCGFSLSELRDLLGREPTTLKEHRVRVAQNAGSTAPSIRPAPEQKSSGLSQTDARWPGDSGRWQRMRATVSANS